jgi:phosphoribosyl-dephospho-CoA transferase
MSAAYVVHDLLRIDPALLRESLVLEDDSLWDVAMATLQRAPFVVVRRAADIGGGIAVGIRGRTRNVRIAAILSPRFVLDAVSPEALRSSLRRRELPVFAALEQIEQNSLWSRHTGGPTGSTGFELATGVQTATSDSDLDLLLRASVPPSPDDLRGLADACQHLQCAVDIQVETPAGAFALQEYLAAAGRVMLRTVRGPRLTEDAWRTPHTLVA